MRLAVSHQPQNAMRGQLLFAAFDHMLSFIVRQHDPLGAALKQQLDGAGLGTTYAVVHPCSMSVKPSING